MLQQRRVYQIRIDCHLVVLAKSPSLYANE
jgi:hypothetical protein